MTGWISTFSARAEPDLHEACPHGMLLEYLPGFLVTDNIGAAKAD